MSQGDSAGPRPRRNPSRALNITLWVLQIGTAAMFLFAAFPKLAGDPKMVTLFGSLGLGQWFRYLTGSLEALGAALLLAPGLAAFGAVILIAVMVGAVFTHLFVIGGNPAMAIVLLISSAVIAWGRREQIRRVQKGKSTHE
jgi:putative oxidoreductase